MTNTDRNLGDNRGIPWTEREIQDAMRMRKHMTCGAIAVRLNRTYKSVQAKLHALNQGYGWKGKSREQIQQWRARYSNGGKYVQVVVIPSEVTADQRKRGAMNPRDLTALVCGDPLPGYSALDRRAL